MKRIVGLLFATAIAGAGNRSAAAAPAADALPGNSGRDVAAESSSAAGRAQRAASLKRQLELATGTVMQARTQMQAAATAGAPAPSTWDTISWDGFELCGDGVVDDAAEQCDRSDLGGATCLSLGYAGGALICNAQCRFETTQCFTAAACTVATCDTDADCGAGCGPCVHDPGWPGYCQGATGGGAE